MSCCSPTLGASKQSAPSNFLLDPCSLVVQGVPPHQRCCQTPCSAQTGTTNYDLFFRPLLLIVTSQEMTIKHLMYMQKVPFLYTERACVLFFRFSNSPRKIFHVNRSVATISDQREYYSYWFTPTPTPTILHTTYYTGLSAEFTGSSIG